MTKTKDKVQKILDKIRPYIQMHGGDVQLIKVEDGTVTLKIQGACAGCPLADLTYNKMIGKLLKEKAPGISNVILEY